MIKNISFLSVLFFLISASCKTVSEDQSMSTFYLVRHAEKTTHKNDPGLTEQGKERAYFLAHYLRDVKLDAVYSTDYFRTRKTAQPTISSQNIKMQLYDASDLTAFAAQLKKNHKNQKVLVVGHSNTTAELSNLLLGKDEFESIPHEEYDNLYIITTGKDAKGERVKYGVEIIEQQQNSGM